VTGKAYPKGVKIGNLINCHTKKDCLVELDFDHSGHSYTVKRGQKPKIFEVIKDGKPLDESSSAIDFQVVLEQLFGMDANTFKQCIVMSARNYTPFLELESSKRREFIEEIFAIRNLSNMKELVKVEETSLTEAIRQNDYELGVTNTRLETIEEYRRREKLNSIEKIAGLKDEKQALEIDNQRAKEEYTNLKIELESLQSAITTLREQIDADNRIDGQVKDIENRIAVLNGKIDSSEKSMVRSAGDIESQKQAKSKAENELKDNKNKLELLSEKRQAYLNKNNDEALSRVQSEIRKTRDSISSLKTTKDALVKQKQFYDSKPTCPTCGQDIDKKFVSGLDLDEKIASSEAEIIELTESLRNLEQESKLLSTEISDAAKLENELNNINAAIKHLEKTMVDSESRIESIRKLITEEQQLIVVNLKAIDALKEQLISVKAEKNGNIEAVKYDLKRIETEQLEVTTKRATVAEAGKNQLKRIAAITEEIASIEGQTIVFNDEDICRAKKIDLESRSEDLKKKMFYVSTIKKMLSDTGIRKFILRRFVPVLNQLLNKYLSILGAKYQIVFDDEMNEKIIARGYDDLSLGNLSGGQIQRVDLALMFSFLEMAKMRNSVRTNLIFFDEILDMSLDAEGLDGVFSIFNMLKKEGYTLYTISHRPEMTHKFGNALTVNMKNFSEVCR
jgi:DNA repair exonuclease SbcCD ATPase subunit